MNASVILCSRVPSLDFALLFPTKHERARETWTSVWLLYAYVSLQLSVLIWYAPARNPIIYAIRETYESTLLSSYFVIISWTQLDNATGTNAHNIGRVYVGLRVYPGKYHTFLDVHSRCKNPRRIKWNNNSGRKRKSTKPSSDIESRRIEYSKKSLCIWNFATRSRNNILLHHVWILPFFA